MTNPFIIFKNWIRRKIGLFVYPVVYKKLGEMMYEITCEELKDIEKELNEL